MLEKIDAGSKLLLAGPVAVARFSLVKGQSPPTFDEARLSPLMAEYQSIHDLLKGLVTAENLFVIDTQIYQKDGTLVTHLTDRIGQQIQGVQSHGLPNLTLKYHNFPRDAHSTINGQMYSNMHGPYEGQFTWINPATGGKLPGSALGEGGAVLTRKEAVLIGEETSWDCEEELEDLQMQGMGVGIMPIINPFIHDVADHIDGYSALVEDKYGDLVLLVARSYNDQTLETNRNINIAAKRAGVGKLVVDDANMPPMAFNLVQFNDLSIAMTSGAKGLQDVLVDLLGTERIHTTRVPIEHFPKASPISIRCLTNIVPEALLS